ncbi:MAG: hypothetical protein ABSG16_19790 [Candidatus Acidiferrum sp.]
MTTVSQSAKVFPPASAGKEIPVKRQEFISKLQQELRKHQKDYFCSEERSMAEGGTGVMAPGCMLCKVRLNTSGQYLEHLLVDVLPQAVERILNDARASG